jgi:hypothetical protein
MSENAGVLVEDKDEYEIREQAWLDRICLIRACTMQLIDNGPTEESLALAQDLADELLRAVDEFNK